MMDKCVWSRNVEMRDLQFRAAVLLVEWMTGRWAEDEEGKEK